MKNLGDSVKYVGKNVVKGVIDVPVLAGLAVIVPVYLVGFIIGGVCLDDLDDWNQGCGYLIAKSYNFLRKEW